MTDRVEPLDEDWDRALAIVAHPDDMEWGAASAVARWTDQGKDVRYLLVTRGEAGIETMPPEQAAPLREREQRASCDAVGVSHLEFLDHADGLVEPGLALRRDLAAAIRRHRPDVLVGISYRDSWGGTSWNHVDHRVVGIAMLDAARDAANPWVFRDAGAACDPVRFVAFSGSTSPTHGVDVTDHLDRGMASLQAHAVYLEALGDPGGDKTAAQLRDWANQAGRLLDVDAAVTFELRTP